MLYCDDLPAQQMLACLVAQADVSGWPPAWEWLANGAVEVEWGDAGIIRIPPLDTPGED